VISCCNQVENPKDDIDDLLTSREANFYYRSDENTGEVIDLTRETEIKKNEGVPSLTKKENFIVDDLENEGAPLLTKKKIL